MKSDPLFIRVPSALCTFKIHLIISDLIVVGNQDENNTQPSLAPLQGLTFKPLFLGQARKPRVGGGVGLFPLLVANVNN
jgi:hypothetical protein